MVTQCPHCATAFNVTPEQLFARDGQVRCGQCRKVFDGLVNLTSLASLEAGVPPPLSEAGAAARQTATVAAPPLTPPLVSPHGFKPVNWPMLPQVFDVPVPPLPLEIVADAQAVADAARASRYDTAPPAPPVGVAAEAVESLVVAPAPEAANTPDTHETREAKIAALIAGSSMAVTAAAAPVRDEYRTAEEIRFEAEAEPAPPRRARWPWAIAATLAALILCGQALYTFRSEIAAHFPAVKPALAQACQWPQSVQALQSLPWAGCTVPPLQRPAALNIQASDMLILDKARPHLVQLIVTLQNQSALDVGYPAIDLVLNDRFDHAIARRVFVPADYLRGADAQKTVIAASVTTTVRIDLDVSELSAGGFGLLLIPAPQS